MAFRYQKTTVDLGDQKIVTKSYSFGMLGNHSKRSVSGNDTAEKVKKHNRTMAVRKVYWLLYMNFEQGDWSLVLTYRRGQRPEIADAHKNVGRFLRMLKAWCIKNNCPFKYIWTTHIGARGGIHHHIILPKQIPYPVICEKWVHGQVMAGQPLFPGKDYEGLANYLYDDTKGGIQPTCHEKNTHRFNCSKNLVRPEVTREIVNARRWAKAPKAPKGWKIIQDSIYNGFDMFGYEYQTYTLVRMIGKEAKRCYADRAATG